MAETRKLILVTGATGKQGGAVACHLLDRGYQLRAITRNPDRPEAKALADRGVDVLKCDLNDRDCVDRAVDGAYGVFSVQAVWEEGIEGEIRQGKLLADSAKAAGVQHFVYSSVGCAQCDTGISFFDSKWQIERHIHALNLRSTILRPVFFMENLRDPMMSNSIRGGIFSLALPPNRSLQLISVDDIGAFTAIAFDNPGDWVGRAVDIAGDELTMVQIADRLSAALGLPVRYNEMPIEQLRSMSPGYATMFEWFNRHGYSCNIPELRSWHPGLSSFNTWLQTSGFKQFVLQPEMAVAA